ncbi:hypothetical protein DL240_01900 [Lujinxingia litoralis]|uniref:Uncharacterized protein n=1 Tax=Lujinxingia litoralis TaxID=2211119 RepID=A0A328CAJ4_9DELT|nr:hypothetical protein [Lujinxingia litoralis]RAL24988.1 hypothetical protein DL240_01900 [Lujinxingia litoralis]
MSDQKHDLEEPRDYLDESRRLIDDARHLYDDFRRDNPLGHMYDRNPYAVLAAAAGVGYVLGGGLFTPFTRRMMRVGLKAMVLPMAASHLRSLTNTELDPSQR